MSRILPILLLIVGLVVTVFLVLQQTNLFSKAGISDIPKEVKISNISDNSFTVSWITDSKAPGFVVFGTEKESINQTALDDRDSGGENARFTHHVTLKNLTPETIYYFKIGSKGELLSQTTAPTTSDTPPLAEPLFGIVVKQEGGVPDEGLVYVSMEKSTVLSSFTREDGNFLITLNNARTANLSQYLTFDTDKKINLTVQAGLEGSAAQDLDSSQRAIPQLLVLQKSASVESSWPADLNSDGVINAVDFAYFVKQQLGL